MSINHHLLAKTATDAVLSNFKAGTWNCLGGLGTDFYRVGCDSIFPSPDASFFDDTNKILTTFEFKPPTENKRGILTGLGQSIAYLNSSNLSYLVIPETIDDFAIGEYMTDLFNNHVVGQLPVGLITYANDDAQKVALIHNVAAVRRADNFKALANGRFWAKHVDLPVALFHLILHCYYLRKIGQINEDAFAYCFSTYLVPDSVFGNLQPVRVFDVAGTPIQTVAGRKDIAFFEKKLAAVRKLRGKERGAAITALRRDASTAVIGDNYYNSIRKNLNTFVKHVGAIDSTGGLTEEGFKLYHLGLVNGPTSKLFVDYFTRLVLLTGHHLDLIFDLDFLMNENKGIRTIQQVKELLLDDYEGKGMIKRNPGRVAASAVTVNFLKYEFILWNNLDLILKTPGQPEISFNWKRITEVCSLPSL